MPDVAEALPEKRLFLDLLTREISLEDAILDLIDNSINSVLLTNEVKLSEVFDAVISGGYDFSRFANYKVDVLTDDDQFQLFDNCGGITYEAAKHEVFRFGRPRGRGRGDTLSVYGIGLKRALFKLGEDIRFESRRDIPFVVAFSATEWEEADGWTLPLDTLPQDALPEGATRICVKGLKEEVLERLRSADFRRSLIRRVQETYSFFIDRFCAISIGGEDVPGTPFQLGTEDSLAPAAQKIEERGVTTVVMAGLAPRDNWETGSAGWYVFCNGRAVLFAERTILTGWGTGLPQYVSKFRGFRGLIFFFAEDAELLPWDTTKTDVNAESIVYRRALNLIFNTARPVLSYLSSLYATDETESAAAKAAAEHIGASPITKVVSVWPTAFSPPGRRVPTTVSVQFSVPVAAIERVRAHLRTPNLSARKIVETAFKYYLENEVG